MNLAQAQQEVMDRGFDYLSATRITFMLNRALSDLEAYWTWPWLNKTATGAAPLIVSDLKYVRSVYSSTGDEMFGVDLDDDIDVSKTGTPENWWIDDTSGTPTLKMWPVGSATLSVRYIATDATLVNPTDTPVLPVQYHGLWIDLAVVRAYQDSDNFAAANALQQQIQADLARMMEQYATRNRMNSEYVRILAGSEDD